MEVALAVGLGGATGAILRWQVGMFISHVSAPAFVGTLVVNLVGSFLVGLLLIWFQGKFPISDVLRTGILVGLLGGFTTYSAFSMDALNMVLAGFYGRAGAYVVVMVAVCLVGTWSGIMLGRSV
jgi:CrcB protein